VSHPENAKLRLSIRVTRFSAFAWSQGLFFAVWFSVGENIVFLENDLDANFTIGKNV